MGDFSSVKAIAFDYYGTIANKLALAGEIDAVFPGQGEAFCKLWFTQTQRYCFLNGLMGRHIPWSELTQAAFKFTAQEMSIDIDVATRGQWIAADSRLPIYPEAPAALERLAKCFNLHVLSMGSLEMIEQSQKNAGITSHFKSVISIESHKIYKPSKAAYDIGASEIGVSPNEVTFVSGNSFDVIGAKNYGYPTIWVRRYGQPLDCLGLTPDLIVTDLSEMAARLDA
jgi:2-haloacid dehalogenase